VKVIVGSWMDDRMDTFNQQVFDSDMSPEAILNWAILDAADFGHTVIAKEDHYVVFSDGTRLVLNLYPVITQARTRSNPELED